MSRTERLSLNKTRPLFYEARKAISDVPQRVHNDHLNLSRWSNSDRAEVIDAFGTTVMTRTGSTTLIDFSLGTELHMSPSFRGRGYSYNSSYVDATFLNPDDQENTEPFSAKINTNGAVIYDKKIYGIADPGIIPALFLIGKPRQERISTIVRNTQSGLIVARHVEQYAALLSNREPEVGNLDQAHADLNELAGEISLEEHVEALLPPLHR